MITFEYGEVCELIEKLDETVTLISTLEDIQLGAAIDNIYEIKSLLVTNLRGFEDMLETMADEYGE